MKNKKLSLLRWFWTVSVFPCTLFVLLGQFFLENSFWTNTTAALGTIITFLSLWVSFEIFKQGNAFNETLESTVDTINKMTLASLKHQYINNIRLLHSLAEKDDRQKKYWHFIWRFETFRELSLMLSDQNDQLIRIVILHSSIKAFDLNYDNHQVGIYTVLIKEDFPVLGFKKGQNAYCCFTNGDGLISAEASELDLIEPTYKFSIFGLGEVASKIVNDDVPKHTRAIDIKIMPQDFNG